MTPDELKKRTKAFALAVISLVERIPRKHAGEILYKQLLRSSSSVGANYRAACRARSKADFVSKVTIVEEEADECCYWIELLIESGLIEIQELHVLLKEANELTAIFTSSGRTAKSKRV